MATTITIGTQHVGRDCPVYVIGEIGINHNGDIDIARQLIEAAATAGCNAVKFQKRTPEVCVPPEQRDVVRDTPWGQMTYMAYRQRVEFGQREYETIDAICKDVGIDWFASPWDVQSIDFLESFTPVCYKVPSACLTDTALLSRLNATGRPVILSTGMSTLEQVRQAFAALDAVPLALTHCTSTYPCPPEELNLRMVNTLAAEFHVPVGYSGHEVGLATTVAAVALGAQLVERHITLDRAMWGSDQAASVEPHGIAQLVKYIRATEKALGDGVKRVFDSELPVMKKLRRCP